MKKNVLLIFVFLSVSQRIFSQKISLKTFASWAEHHEIGATQVSEFDRNYLFTELKRSTHLRLRPAISIEFKNKDFLELSGWGYERTEQEFFFVPRIFLIDSSQFDTIGRFPTGEGNRKKIEVQADYFWHFPHLESERLRTYWGISMRGYHLSHNFEPDPNADFYPFQRKRTGMFFLLNTRLHWEFYNPAWQIQGIFGIQTFDFSRRLIQVENPDLALRQQSSTIFDFDLSLNAFWKIGISYTFGKKLEN